VEIRVLGPVELVGTDGVEVALQGNKMRGLLAALALEGGRAVSAERLIDTLWGDQEVSGANVVQVLVSKLRRVVAAAGGPDLVATTPAGYQLAGSATTDLSAFESLVGQARAAEDPGASALLLERSLGLWRGSPLGGAPDTEVLAGVRTRLVEMRNAAIDDLTDARLGLGRHHLVVAELEQLVAEQPLRERRWAQLMRSLYGKPTRCAPSSGRATC
jgi:DNA-binding SARP family transcriptional activator